MPMTYPCAPLQLGLVYESLSSGERGFYAQQLVATLTEELDVELLVEAWRTVVRRHGILRTTFDVEGVETPRQRVAPDIDVSVIRHDWRGLTPAEREAAWERLLAADRSAGFALAAGPPWRLTLCRSGDLEHRLLWTYHHALLDGRSRLILLRELFTAYDSLLAGAQLRLPDPPQFGAFAEWIWAEDRSEAERYWTGLLSTLTAPTALPDSDDEPGPAGERALRLGACSSVAVARLAERADVTVGTVLHAAFALLLCQETGDAEAVYGTTRAGRNSPPLPTGGMVGLLMNTIPVRQAVDPEQPLRDLLAEVRRQAVAVRPFEHTPLIDIQRCSEVPAGEPLFNTLFSFENHSMNSVLRREGPDWAARDFQLHERLGYGLALTAYDDDGLLFKLLYDGTRVGAEAGDRLLRRYVAILEDMTAGPGALVGEIGLLPAADRRRVLVDWGSGGPAPPVRRAHDGFLATARRLPEAVALEAGGERLTYGQLDARVDCIVRRLAAARVAAGSRVGLALPRGIDMVAAMLATWKAGCAWVPLDPAYPAERLAFMIVDSGARALLTIPELEARLDPGEATVIPLGAAVEGSAGAAPADPSGPDDLAFVIYTSGSTGRPKGVMVEHRGVAASVDWAAASFSAQERARVLASTSLNFDPSVFQLLLALSFGGTAVVVENLLELAEPHCDPRPTLVNSAPSVIGELLEHGELPRSVRTVVLGGEPLTSALVDRLHKHPGVERVVNLYGPTEDTMFSTVQDCPPGARRAPAIGRPTPGGQAYVLDQRRRPVAAGVPGELHLGGAGVARGYVNRPGLTRERFVENTLEGTPPGRLYRTGDRARWRADGALEFMGRIDQQLKVRGFRIEPGEVESALVRDPRVARAAVLAVPDRGASSRLVAYVVFASGSTVEPAELRDLLSQSLPAHMVPSAFVAIDTMPLTPNGKLDLRRLPASAESSSENGNVAPRTWQERLVAEAMLEVLDLRRLPGPEGDFFELGGHSFLALKFLALLERRSGTRLPIGMFLRRTTVAAIARRLSAAGLPSANGGLVPVRAGGQQPPWFCIQTDRRGMLALRNFVEPLGEHQPIYGLQAADPTGGVWEAESIGDIAVRCLDAIRAVRPEGPYFLSGHSLGGLVAYDVACRLESDGEWVRLMLLDTVAPGVFRLPQRVRVHLAGLSELPHSARAREIGRLGLRVLRRLAHKNGRQQSQPRALEQGFAGIIDMQEALRLRAAYRPGQLRGRMVLFATAKSIGVAGTDSLGWEKLVQGGIETVRVPGDHLSMLIEPDVRPLARELAIRLLEAQDET